MSSTSKDGTLALCGSLMSLSVVAVTLRFCSRRSQRLPLLADDWTALLGVLTYVGTCIIVFILVQNKILGYYEPGFTGFTGKEGAARARLDGQTAYAFDFLNTTTLAATKSSALFFYRRIFHVGHADDYIFNRAVMALEVIIVCWYITFQFVAFFQCPGYFSAEWTVGAAKFCTLSYSWAIGLAISDFLLDFIVLLFPIPRVLKLNANLARKLSIIGIFCLAFVGLGASIGKIVVFLENVEKSANLFSTSGFEKIETELIYVQMLESGIAITAVNLPSLWHLCTTTIPRSLSSSWSRLRGAPAPSPRSESAAHKASGTDMVPMIDVPAKGLREPQRVEVRPPHSPMAQWRDEWHRDGRFDSTSV